MNIRYISLLSPHCRGLYHPVVASAYVYLNLLSSFIPQSFMPSINYVLYQTSQSILNPLRIFPSPFMFSPCQSSLLSFRLCPFSLYFHLLLTFLLLLSTLCHPFIIYFQLLCMRYNVCVLTIHCKIIILEVKRDEKRGKGKENGEQETVVKRQTIGDRATCLQGNGCVINKGRKRGDRDSK